MDTEAQQLTVRINYQHCSNNVTRQCLKNEITGCVFTSALHFCRMGRGQTVACGL
jgi:hypothetical protein